AGVAETPTLRIGCESANEFQKSPQPAFSPVEGISGHACAGPPAIPGLETDGKSLEVSKRTPLTFSLWVDPSPNDVDAALLSAIDYSQNPASTTFGHGMGLRLVGGAIEFRFSDRFPAYSIRVRSQGAHLAPNQWRHIAVAYQGAGKADQRVRAGLVRIFVDGQELPTLAVNDDLALPDEKGDKPKAMSFRIGQREIVVH